MASPNENKQLAKDYFRAFQAHDEEWWARHISPDFVRHDPGLPFEVRGVDGVRPTDLVARAGGALSRGGIDLAAAGSRRLRAPIEKGAQRASERARHLPPVSAFGRRGGTDRAQVRFGVGMR